MKIRAVLIELTELLQRDLAANSPYSMAQMGDYGRVAQYAPDYRALQLDCLDYLAICEHLFPGSDFAPAFNLPPLTPNRLMSEAFFDNEKAVLSSMLSDIHRALNMLTDEALAHRRDRLPEDVLDALFALLERNGAALPAPANARRTAQPQEPAATGGGRIVYVSSRFAAQLGAQLREELTEIGFDPASERPDNLAQGAIDLESLGQLIRPCVGGVFSVALAPDQVSDVTNFRSRGAPAPERAIATCAAEVAFAERTLGENILLVANQAALDILPDHMRDRRLFVIEGAKMTMEERAQLQIVFAQTEWLGGQTDSNVVPIGMRYGRL